MGRILLGKEVSCVRRYKRARLNKSQKDGGDISFGSSSLMLPEGPPPAFGGVNDLGRGHMTLNI